MLRLPISDPFHTPPPGAILNRAHPYSGGLVALYLFNENCGNAHDCTNSARAATGGGGGTNVAANTGGIGWSPVAYGAPMANMQNSITKYFQLPYGLSEMIAGGKDWSVGGIIMFVNGWNQCILGPRAQQGALNIIVNWQLNNNILYLNEEDVSFALSSIHTLAPGARYFYFFTKRGNTISLYLNGRLDTSATYQWSTNWQGNYLIGNNTNAGSPSSKSIDYCGPHWFYNRAISAAQIADMYRNPYENIIAGNTRRFSDSSGAAGGNIYAVALSLAGTQDSAERASLAMRMPATVACASGVRITLGSNQYACVLSLASTGGFTAAESIPSVMTVTILRKLTAQSNHTYQLRAQTGRTIMKRSQAGRAIELRV